ncbi:uncharacterized protein LOC120794516 [Xiphias gladius]|uniref:uncharacterized protein LOC120794516 n=1 Tax=Xiphias gladius TaxID=8245 RepID=UPI001A995C41|nr:uncharacterized protein LOC120794516 [Xiphias gladius]
MSGAHRMQELEYFRGGATLVISLDGLNWLSRRRCSDKGNTKRDEELQFWISSGQRILADEKLQPNTCFCILDQKGSAALSLWRNTDRPSSLVTRPSSFSLSPEHCRPLEEPVQHSAFTSLASPVAEGPKEVLWTKFILNMRDIFTLITKNVNVATKQQTITMDRPNRFIFFCDEDIPSRFFSDICYTQDCRTFKGNTVCHISGNNNMSSDLKNSAAHSPSDPNNNSEDDQNDMVITDNFNICTRKSLLKSCQNYNHTGESSGRDRNVKMRKRVSFDDDVVVYLFDQESPTVELHSEPCTSLPGRSSCNQPDVALEDSGLEWEDDFSALEKNCHFQCVSHSQHSTLSLPTQSWTALSRPERYFLSQTCLFLTHVTESDLEL